jgi:hypothetical protein
MRHRIPGLLLVVFAFSCVMKNSPPDLEKNLKTAMQTYLYSTVNNDSSNVKYHVQNVVYYDDPKLNAYICDFTVYMKTKLFDTTGIMHATVSKDFKTVKRAS